MCRHHEREHGETRLWIRHSLRAILSDLSMYIDGRIMHVDVAEGYKLRLEMMSRELLALRVVSLMTLNVKRWNAY